jgi:hypothetical protein
MRSFTDCVDWSCVMAHWRAEDGRVRPGDPMLKVVIEQAKRNGFVGDMPAAAAAKIVNAYLVACRRATATFFGESGQNTGAWRSALYGAGNARAGPSRRATRGRPTDPDRGGGKSPQGGPGD